MYKYRVWRDLPANELTAEEVVDMKKARIQSIASLEMQMLDYASGSDQYKEMANALQAEREMLEELNNL